MPDPVFYLATRGSALALAQANMVLDQCRRAAPNLAIEIKVIKTTGDKLQTASMAQEGHALPKGLFTKELEIALLNGEAGLAVHSLKDLPTDLPSGLVLGAVTRRADVRDVLIYRSQSGGAGRGFPPGTSLADLPADSTIATSSTRRKAQLRAIAPGIQTPDIRGNVATRLRKLAENPELDATVLACAGMNRLNYSFMPDGRIEGSDVPAGLLACILDADTMLPCVGQGAIGIEIRSNDEVARRLCEQLNNSETARCVTAERAFLSAMGGGCQSPVAALAQTSTSDLVMTAISFAHGPARRAILHGRMDAPAELGQRMAAELKK